MDLKLELCALEIVDGAADRTARRIIEWPVMPRKGENLLISGNYHEVNDVWHRIDPTSVSELQIMVDFHCDHEEFERILEDLEWKLWKWKPRK